MPPAERERLIDTYRRYRMMPPERRMELRQRFRELSPEQRQILRERRMRQPPAADALQRLDGLHELGGFRLAVAVEHARVIEIEQRVLDP